MIANSTTVLQLIVSGTDSLDALAAKIGQPKKKIVKFTQTLKGLGYITVCDKLDEEMGTGARGMYLATEAGEAFVKTGNQIKPGKAGPRPRQRTIGLRERAWWHFRAHKVASIKDLLTTHANGTEKAAHINLFKYAVALESVGILKRLPIKQAAKQSKGRVIFSLEKDLGMKPPVWRQTAREIYDPNHNQVFKIPEKAAVEEVEHVE